MTWSWAMVLHSMRTSVFADAVFRAFEAPTLDTPGTTSAAVSAGIKQSAHRRRAPFLEVRDGRL
ncbi:hypothetical protein [Arthrobacter sp. Z4-13]